MLKAVAPEAPHVESCFSVPCSASCLRAEEDVMFSGNGSSNDSDALSSAKFCRLTSVLSSSCGSSGEEA